MDNQTPKSSRRIRYKGTHPKSFKEKYKELNPENFSEDVQKVMQQGRTPAGMHRSICVNEIMDFLNIQPGQIGMDATLGYGGHSLEMLKRLAPNGHLYATDVDPFELPKTRDRLAALGFGPEVLTIKKMNFSCIVHQYECPNKRHHDLEHKPTKPRQQIQKIIWLMSK